MKSVCIIGAGPAGLVAAKVFLQTGKFAVTVLEKKSRIGGIWALDQDSQGGFLSPKTPTNLSRFTVGFSDLAWNSVDFHKSQTDGSRNGSINSEPPMFPPAYMANKYLETYRQKYIPGGTIKCDHEVLKAERRGEAWTITVKDGQSNVKSQDFDYLIMASGFFSTPRTLAQTVPGAPESFGHSTTKAMHTSAFRSLEDLFPDGKCINGKNILVLGGGNSSGEAAAAAAFQLSDAQWSPNISKAQRFKDVRVVHVTARPLYPLPPYVEYEDGSRSYVPLDFKLYDFSRRPRDLPSYGGRQPMEVRNIVHGALQTMMGSDLADVSEAIVSHKGDRRGSVYVALSEGYAEYVRSGMINLVSGRVTEIIPAENGGAVAVVKRGNEEQIIRDVAAIIYATGYSPSPALEILDETTKKAIHYDSKSLRLPIILEQWQTMSKAAPAISFLGFYEGPYWPVMEMQARITAERWLSGKLAPLNGYESRETLLELRQSMHDRGQDVPQYWFGDHLGYMEGMAKQLALKRNDSKFAEWEGIPSPARYLSPGDDAEEASNIMQELQRLWGDCAVSGRYVARAAFRAMHGRWSIQRSIDSAVSTFPSGTLSGTASFYPRSVTPDKSNASFDLEYLYVESGTFILSNGSSMTAKRRYVYRYSEADDALSVWFVKPDNDLEVDYFFHNLTFVKPAEAKKAGALVAMADHPCGNDMYWTEYRLPMKGVALLNFRIRHIVKGPNKDYVAVTEYEHLKS